MPSGKFGDDWGNSLSGPIRSRRPFGTISSRPSTAGLERPLGNVRQFEGRMLYWSPRTRPDYFTDFLEGALVSPAVIRDTSPAGSPTFTQRADIANGVFRASLDATSELQVVGFDWGDQRMCPANKAWELEAYVSLPAPLVANESFFVGVASDYNTDPELIDRSAWWRVDGGPNGLVLLAEADDGIVDLSVVTSQALVAGQFSLLRLRGSGDGNVEFWVEDDLVTRLKVDFDSTALQPVFYLRKSTGTTTPSADIDFIMLSWDRF